MTHPEFNIRADLPIPPASLTSRKGGKDSGNRVLRALRARRTRFPVFLPSPYKWGKSRRKKHAIESMGCFLVRPD